MIDALARQSLGEFLATMSGAFGLRGRRFGFGSGFESGLLGWLESIEESGSGDRLGTGTIESLQKQV